MRARIKPGILTQTQAMVVFILLAAPAILIAIVWGFGEPACVDSEEADAVPTETEFGS